MRRLLQQTNTFVGTKTTSNILNYVGIWLMFEVFISFAKVK